MPCRVGITRDPLRRKQEWENDVIGLKNWRQEYVGSKSNAQKRETQLHELCELQGVRGTCHAHPGGGDPNDYGWYVYDFDYDRVK